VCGSSGRRALRQQIRRRHVVAITGRFSQENCPVMYSIRGRSRARVGGFSYYRFLCYIWSGSLRQGRSHAHAQRLPGDECSIHPTDMEEQDACAREADTHTHTHTHTHTSTPHGMHGQSARHRGSRPGSWFGGRAARRAVSECGTHFHVSQIDGVNNAHHTFICGTMWSSARTSAHFCAIVDDSTVCAISTLS
jgi:hypothetical protein